MKRSGVVGHVPKKISTICSLFLRSGTITCEVNGSRQYSADLHQGGLEVPCKLRFACCDQELLTKTQKLLFLALQKGDSETPLKKIKLEPVETPEEVTVDDIKGVMPSAVILDDAERLNDFRLTYNLTVCVGRTPPSKPSRPNVKPRPNGASQQFTRRKF